MNTVIDVKDWSEVKKAELFDFDKRTYDDGTSETEQSTYDDKAASEKELSEKKYIVDHYFPRYFSLRGHDLSPFNMGIYCETKGDKPKLRSTQYVGVVPLLLMKGKKSEIENNEDYPVIKVSSRFNISPTEMLSKVLSGDDYYENPDMLKTRYYTEREWKELALHGNKVEERALFGVINGIGQIDLSHQEDGNEKRNESNLGIVDAYGVFEIIDFVNKAKEICKKSLKKQSLRVEENLNCKVKGRILVQKQIKYNEVRGQKQKMYCAYNMMSENIKENQIIKYALHLCRKKSGIGDSLVEDIQFCMNALCGVPLKKCSTSDFVGLKNNGAYRQYKEVLIAAKKIISRYSLSYENGATDNTGEVKAQLTNHKVLPYFIDMNLLFEYYCRAIFRKAINEYNKEKGTMITLSLESQKDSARLLFKCDSDYMKKYWRNWQADDDDEDNEDSNGKNENTIVSLRHFFMARYIPDIVITYESENDNVRKVAAVIDAKYSDVESAEKRSRTHQIMFYMKALDCNYGGLISPSSKNRTEIVSGSVWINQKIEKMKGEKVTGPGLCYIPLAGEKGTGFYVDLVKKYLKDLGKTINERENERRKNIENKKFLTKFDDLLNRNQKITLNDIRNILPEDKKKIWIEKYKKGEK